MFVVLDTSGVTSHLIQIGQINLDIQLTVNSSYLKPRIEELSMLFSKELDVKSSQVSQTDKHTITCKPKALFLLILSKTNVIMSLSQVNLSNLTSRGNNSLIRMVVVPPEPSTWFSNVTATVFDFIINFS